MALRRAAATHARVATALVRVRARLWIDPALATAPAPPVAPVTPDAGEVARVAGAVRVWSRAVPRATCLVQALAAREVLAARGVASELCFAASADGRALRAHAWLEVDGVAIVGDGPGPHAPLGSLGARRATRAA